MSATRNSRNPLLDNFPTYGHPPPKIQTTVKDSIQPETNQSTRPVTPDNIKQYRSSHHGIGQSRTNIRNISISNEKPFGRANVKDDSTGELMQSQLRSAVGDTLNQQKEARVYKSTKTDPLGRRQFTNTVLPDKTHEENYKFGISTAQSEPVKNLLYPVDRSESDSTSPHSASRVKEMYKKTHNAYDVGEQKQRSYKWDNTRVKDPSKFSFGIQVTSNGTVQDCLKPSQVDKGSGFNEESNIVSMIQERHNQFTRDPLGRTKPQDLPVDADNHVFGKKNVEDEFDARACIQGEYSESEQQPDPDLGKSLSYGYRNESKDPNRVFGIPTIRNDLRKPSTKSITDSQNYGNEPDAMCSIRPSKYATLGIQEDDFDTLMEYEDLKDLCMSAALVNNEEEFKDIFDYALAQYGEEIEVIRQRDRDTRSKEVPLCTVDLLRKALGEITLAKEEM